ncbi:MAG TPA: hypothetical protein VN834_04935 [Candidatus Acidoferrum sp.]|nr:hypothetical protein [Candidatus Acidoferrum sp.]
MAKKAAPKKAAPKKPKHENVIERIGEELEARFFEGAELATETSSAETNIALAALGAIEGPRDAKQPAAAKATHGKPKSPRPKKR